MWHKSLLKPSCLRSVGAMTMSNVFNNMDLDKIGQTVAAGKKANNPDSGIIDLHTSQTMCHKEHVDRNDYNPDKSNSTSQQPDRRSHNNNPKQYL